MKVQYEMSLEPISFFEGEDITLQYDITNTDTGAPVDVSTTRGITVSIFPYGDYSQPLLTYTGSAVRVGDAWSSFTVSIPAADTEGLKGLYVHEPKLIDDDGEIYKPGHGLINIMASPET